MVRLFRDLLVWLKVGEWLGVPTWVSRYGDTHAGALLWRPQNDGTYRGALFRGPLSEGIDIWVPETGDW